MRRSGRYAFRDSRPYPGDPVAGTLDESQEEV